MSKRHFLPHSASPVPHLGHPLQEGLQPVLVALTVAVQERQDLGLGRVGAPDPRAHQACGRDFKSASGYLRQRPQTSSSIPTIDAPPTSDLQPPCKPGWEGQSCPVVTKTELCRDDFSVGTTSLLGAREDNCLSPAL